MRRTWPLLLLGLALALCAGMVLGVVPVPFAGSSRSDLAPEALPDAVGVGKGPIAGAPGLAPAATRSEADAPLPAPVDLERVDRDLDLHGVVVTGDGKPVAGARLTTVSHPGRRGGLLDPAMHALAVEGVRTRSATDGTFAIRLRRGERLSLRAEAAGFATRELFGCTAGQRLRVVLAPGVRCVVRLRDEAGASVPGVRVRMFRPEYASLDVFDRFESSGADGVARFEGLSGDGWAFVDPQPTRLGGVVWKRVTLPAAGEVAVEIVLPTGRTIRGRVTDARTGAGIPGARVAIGWTMSSPVSTDAEGRYEILGWHDAQGADDLHAAAEGYARSGVTVGERETADFALTRSDAAIGRVVDATGRPLPGVLVGCVDVGDHAGSVEGDVNATGTTGRDGRFRLGDLRHGTRHSLVFLGEGLARTLLDVPAAEAEGSVLDVGDVVLRAGRRIEGRVLDADGRPVIGQQVSLEGANADRARLVGDAPARKGATGEEEEAYTDDLGRYRFPDLAPGTYTLSVRLPGGEIPPREVMLGADADALGVDLRVPDGRDLVVRVRDERGDVLAQAFVSAFGPERQGVSGMTDARGMVTLRITRGAWKVGVFWSRELDAKGRSLLGANDVAVSDADDEVEIRLEDAGTLSGVVRDTSGTPLARALVGAFAPGRPPGATVTDAEGRFILEVAAAGVYAVRVTGQHDPDHPGQILEKVGERLGVRAGDADVILLARPAPKDRAFTLVVEGPDGTPVVGARVMVSGWTGAQRRLATGEGGRVAVGELSSRPLDVEAAPDAGHEDVWIAARPQKVVPDGQTVSLRLRVGVAVSGRVHRADGRPARDVYVGAHATPLDGEGDDWTATTDAEGRFRLLVDPELNFPLIVTARPDGGEPARAQVERFDGVEVPIRLEK